MKHYRIGEYTKYLGVTPDLLKHYEDIGLIRSERSESGYRYYSFSTTVELLESIRLRNYGLTLREIRAVMQERRLDNAQVEALMDERVERLRQEIQLDQALLEEYEAFRSWKRPLEKREADWEIRWSEPQLFLPHTDRDDFLHDERIYELLNQWMSFLPMVKSAMRVAEGNQLTWGFLVSERMLQRLGLPLNDVVERLPARKIFCYKYRGRMPRMDQESPDNEEHPAFRCLRGLGLEPGENYFRITLQPADWQQGLGYQYGYYAIPLRDA